MTEAFDRDVFRVAAVRLRRLLILEALREPNARDT